MHPGERVKVLRIEKNISQKELAEELGVNSSHLSRFELGKGRMSLPTLQRIAQILDVTVSYLLGEEEKPHHREKNLDEQLRGKISELEKVSPLDLAISCKALTYQWEDLSLADKEYILHLLEWTNRTLKGERVEPVGEDWSDPATTKTGG